MIRRGLILFTVILSAMGSLMATDASRVEQVIEQADSYVDVAPDSALILCRQAFELLGDSRDSLYARTLLIAGNANFSMGELDEARSLMAQARDAAAAAGDEYCWINSTADLGVVYRVSQQPDSALLLYNEALQAIPEGQYETERAHLLTSIAILYANTGRLDEAVDYGEKAVASAHLSDDIEMIMYANSSAGAIHNLLGNSQRALQLLNLTVTEARRMQLPRYELKAYANLIDTHLRAGHRDSVDFYLHAGDELSRLFPEESVEGIGFLEEKYVVYSALGRYRESIDVQRHLLSLNGKAPTFMPIDKLWLRMARNYDALHMPDSARICYERAFALADSLRAEEVDSQLSDFYAKYKTAEKEIEVAQLERAKAQSDAQTMMWLMIAMACLTAVIGLSLWVWLRRRKEELRQVQARLDGIDTERARLAKDLHDGVCNDLYGVELMMQSAKTQKDEVLDSVERIRSDIRAISHELMPPQFTDTTLVQAVSDYIDRASSTDSGARISLSTSPSGNASEWARIPGDVGYQFYRILQELLSNMLRHGHATQIEVKLSLTSELLTLSIAHNGTASDSVQGHGVGLNSINQRIKAIGATASGLPFSQLIEISYHLIARAHGKP